MKRLQRAKLVNLNTQSIIDETLQRNLNSVLEKNNVSEMWRESRNGLTLRFTVYQGSDAPTIVESSLIEVQG